MKNGNIYVLADGSYLVISPAGIQTTVFPSSVVDGHAMAAAERLRQMADGIERAASATAPLHIPGICRSVEPR